MQPIQDILPIVNDAGKEYETKGKNIRNKATAE